MHNLHSLPNLSTRPLVMEVLNREGKKEVGKRKSLQKENGDAFS